MRNQFLALVGGLAGVIIVARMPILVAGQAPTAAAKATTKAAPKVWTPPRTPWGEPDLQGIWSWGSDVPLERPAEFAGREFLTDEEVAALNAKKAVDPGRDRRPAPGSVEDVSGAYNAVFNSVLRTGKRTSLVVDPPDGKIPALTAEAQQRPASPAPDTGRSSDGPEDRSWGERCLGSMMPDFGGGTFGDGTIRIVQSPKFVTIYYEHTHGGGAHRIIPVDGSAHLPSDIRLWLGDARGKWEGNTLVVDTTNFSPKVEFETIGQRALGPRGSHENLHLVERFTREDANTVRREIRIEDPTTWTRPWTVVVDLNKNEDKYNRIFESACHEGNFGMTGILSGSRAQEKSAEAAKPGAK